MENSITTSARRYDTSFRFCSSYWSRGRRVFSPSPEAARFDAAIKTMISALPISGFGFLNLLFLLMQSVSHVNTPVIRTVLRSAPKAFLRYREPLTRAGRQSSEVNKNVPLNPRSLSITLTLSSSEKPRFCPEKPRYRALFGGKFGNIQLHFSCFSWPDPLPSLQIPQVHTLDYIRFRVSIKAGQALGVPLSTLSGKGS